MCRASRSTEGFLDFVCNRATVLRVGVRCRSVTGHRLQKFINGGQDTLIYLAKLDLSARFEPAFPSYLVSFRESPLRSRL